VSLSIPVVSLVKKIFGKPVFILAVWLSLATVAGLQHYALGHYNNYRIFKNVFWNSVEGKNLYALYPDEHNDSNHYGPFFAVVFAPFAMMPDALGLCLWIMFNGAVLFYAIRQLPLKESAVVALLWLVTNELFTSYSNQQINPLVAASIILAYTWMRKEKDFWAAAVIMAGTFIKLYSIAGLAFFFFSKHKTRLVAACLFWAIVCFSAPMVISGPAFVVQSYRDWYVSLKTKDELNAKESRHQDISLSGVVRRVSGHRDIPMLYFLIPGLMLFLLPYLKTQYYDDTTFQQLMLCSVLLFVCLFSSSTESSTYIVAFTGVSLWFLLHEPPPAKIIWGLLIFAFVLTSLSPTDLVPRPARTFITTYSLKAVPCVLVWLYLMAELLQYSPSSKWQKTMA
jgi:hypothetical protein